MSIDIYQDLPEPDQKPKRAAFAAPGPGGEPLWSVPNDLAAFVSKGVSLNREITGGSRE
jgi:hypothetical protein